MQQSVQLNSQRSTRLNSQKQYSSVNGISKSLTVSQSQGKVMQRYFYRRQSANQPRIQLLKLKKLKSEKMSSLHNHSNHSVKNTITHGDEDPKQQQLVVDLPILSFQKTDTNQVELPPVKLQKIRVVQQQLQIQTYPQPPITPKIFGVNKRSSDWSLLYQKNANAFSKKRSIVQNKPKINIEIKISREKMQGVHSNLQLMIKKHKAENVKQIQQKLRSAASRARTSQYQKLVTMKQFNRKCGYNQMTKIYIWNSEDEHIRRILTRWGWIENPSTESPFFHLKWTYTPLFQDQRVNDKQLINHFKNTHEITSKSYLTKNLKINQCSFGKISSYYPKCYDVGNTAEWLYFIQQYNHNIMLILLKKIYKLFTLKCPQKMQKYDLFYAYLFKNDLYLSQNDLKFRKKSPLRNQTKDSDILKCKIIEMLILILLRTQILLSKLLNTGETLENQNNKIKTDNIIF